MKELVYASTFLASLGLISCGTTEAQKKATTPVMQNIEMQWLDLTPGGINALIQVPATVKIIDDPYDLIIGDGKDICIEISQTTQSFTEIKSFVEKNDVRGFVKFVQQDNNGFIAEMNAFHQTEFDFSFYTSIANENYFLKDPGKFHHPNIEIINAMYSYAKSIKAK